MKRILLLIMSLILALSSLIACDGGGNNSSDTSESTGGETSSGTSEAQDDYGDPSGWAGEKMVTADLGDCLVDVYPYDERYDWGQSIIYDDADKLYKMYWCRHSGYDSIWYAESRDLKHWFNAEKLLAVDTTAPAMTWIKLHVGKPAVIKVGSEYKMYFEAPATLNGYKEFDNNIFLATSTDGKKWKISEKDNEPYPIIRMTDMQMQDSWNKSQLSGGSGYGYYGIGQPSVTYKDGTYYLYYTYSLEAGDRMYVSTSTDGINFSEGKQVFLRAGSGIKYNVKTQKFMFAYEYSSGGMSKVYYMESDDGFNFTYADYTSAANNQNILSKGGGFVRGYPDFVSDALGQVDGYTCYVAYMEGKMADAGKDWRQYSATWDIHIAMFNLKEYANRPMTLPNGKINNKENITPYRDKMLSAYETKREALVKGEDGEISARDKSLYDGKTSLVVDRVVCNERAVPGTISAKVYARYTKDYLYLFVEVSDETTDESDYVYIGIDEKRFAEENAQVSNVEIKRSGVVVTDGDGETIESVKTVFSLTDKGYNVEIKYPWRYISGDETGKTIGFDCFVYNNRNSLEYKSAIAWNDYKVEYNINRFGELYLK